MKHLFLAAAIAMSGSAWANSVGSLYNGKQFDLDGRDLVQDADRPNEFYVVPARFKIVPTTISLGENGEETEQRGVNHRVMTINGQQYSVYTIRVRLDKPNEQQILLANNKLYQKFGAGAQVVGMAPVCGINLGAPLTEVSAGASSARPDAVVIRYNLQSTEAGKCESALFPRELTLTIYAPMSMEPQIAQDITSKVGLVIPAIELVLRYKYQDKVSVTIDAKNTYDQLKASAGIEGGYKFVSGSLSGNMTKMFNKLKVTGRIHRDCQNPDPAICDGFVEKAQELLKEIVFKYTPLATPNPDTKNLIVGDKEKVSANMVRVDMAMDKQEFENHGEFVFDFTSNTYSSIRTQAIVDLKKVNPEHLAKEVQDLLKGLE